MDEKSRLNRVIKNRSHNSYFTTRKSRLVKHTPLPQTGRLQMVPGSSPPTILPREAASGAAMVDYEPPRL